jgi:hypothetical protein
MSSEHDKSKKALEGLIETILQLAEEQPWFNLDFVLSCQEQLDTYESLSDKQIDSLHNIMDMLESKR